MTHLTSSATGKAQRRLIEALAEMYNTPDLDIGICKDPLDALHMGIVFAADIAKDAGQPMLAKVQHAYANLILEVRHDQKEAVNG